MMGDFREIAICISKNPTQKEPSTAGFTKSHRKPQHMTYKSPPQSN